MIWRLVSHVLTSNLLERFDPAQLVHSHASTPVRSVRRLVELTRCVVMSRLLA